eukprot:11158398-Lingulodinium_polyedra.AAC.1
MPASASGLPYAARCARPSFLWARGARVARMARGVRRCSRRSGVLAATAPSAFCRSRFWVA